jgi:hypothetical protein
MRSSYSIRFVCGGGGDLPRKCCIDPFHLLLRANIWANCSLIASIETPVQSSKHARMVDRSVMACNVHGTVDARGRISDTEIRGEINGETFVGGVPRDGLALSFFGAEPEVGGFRICIIFDI